MKDWLRKKILRWMKLDPEGVQKQILDLEDELDRLNRLTKDLVSIGVDVHFKSPHMILIYSRLDGGQLREIKADFKDLRTLNEFVRNLRRHFNTEVEYIDAPPQMKNYWR